MFFSSWRKLVQQVRRQSGKFRRGQRQPAETRKSTWLLCEELEERTMLSTTVYQWTGADTLHPALWNDGSNWTVPGVGGGGAYPGLTPAGDVAQFVGGAVTVPSITLTTSITLAEIDFNSSSTFSIVPNTGAETITLDGTSGPGTSSIKSLGANTGTETITAQLIVANTNFVASLRAAASSR